MVRYAVANGNANARRNARDKHFVLFDQARDNGAAIKNAFPDIGWVFPDMEDCPTLPFSVAMRLMLQCGAEQEATGKAAMLFAEFPTAQLLDRFWAALAPLLNLSTVNIFGEVVRAADAAVDKTPFIMIRGDWEPVESWDADWGYLARWVGAVTRGDVFAHVPSGKAGLAAAELLFYAGPYMQEEHRDDDTHFDVVVKLMGKLFESDTDESLCDGPQLASEVAAGMLETAWPDLFMQVPAGNDDTPDSTKGGPRITDLRGRLLYANSRTSADASTTKHVIRILPQAVKRAVALPTLAVIFKGATNGTAIAESLIDIATDLKLSNPQRIDDRSLRLIEKSLSPISPVILASAIADLPEAERLAAVRERIEDSHLADKGSSASPADGGHAGPDKAAGKLLITQLTKPDALFQLERLSKYRASADYDPVSFLEMAHSGRWPPELRAAKLAAASLLAAGRARSEALAELEDDDLRTPIPPLMQLAWGHVRALEGYPELQDIYDLGQTRMTEVVARLCARAYSADGTSVPSALRFAHAVKLTAALKGRSWDTDVDLPNDADACMLSYIEGGDGSEIQRVPASLVYADISQLARCKRIGANLFAFFGIRDSSQNSWRQLVASGEHALMSIPASSAVKRTRAGKALQRFVTRALGDVGKRIDLVRYTAKHDAVGPTSLLARAKGGPADEFAEAIARIADDQKRRRSEVADDANSITTVRLPAEGAELWLPRESNKRVQIAPGGGLATAAVEKAATGAGGANTSDGAIKWTAFTVQVLVAKRRKDTKPATIHVDAKGAFRWFKDNGVDQPCLPYQFALAIPDAKPFQSCNRKGSGEHTAATSGPHVVIKGWKEAAHTFVKPSDRKLFGA